MSTVETCIYKENSNQIVVGIYPWYLDHHLAFTIHGKEVSITYHRLFFFFFFFFWFDINTRTIKNCGLRVLFWKWTDDDDKMITYKFALSDSIRVFLIMSVFVCWTSRSKESIFVPMITFCFCLCSSLIKLRKSFFFAYGRGLYITNKRETIHIHTHIKKGDWTICVGLVE